MKSTTFSRLAVAAAVTGAMAVSSSAMADTYTATATVNNVITLTETAPLNFGSFAISTDGANAATLVLTELGAISAPTNAPGDAFTPLGGHTAAQIDATVAPFTAVTFTPPTPPFNLTHSSGNPALPVFTVNAITNSTATPTADAAGTASIFIGGTLIPDGAAIAGAYVDGAYTGPYDVTVSY